MEFAAILLTLLVYGAAGYIWWLFRTPIFLIAILAGHLSALASPLWRLLYGLNYSAGLNTIQAVLGQPIPFSLIVAAGWFYPLPALVVLYLYLTRWWFPGYLTGMLTYAIFLLYHLLIESLGLRNSLWSYEIAGLPLGLSRPLLTAIMSGLISYGLLYLVINTYRSSWLTMTLTVLPAALLLSLLVHGLLGAPIWATLILGGAGWALALGTICALGLLAWGVHIVTLGLARSNG
ncbi:MAG: hypothetical protein HC822_06900 [Oscillochloris sp.]|nr:hypothetical protein [Oscillochloris sp.]